MREGSLVQVRGLNSFYSTNHVPREKTLLKQLRFGYKLFAAYLRMGGFYYPALEANEFPDEGPFSS